jgi:hypothetical protein
MWIGIYHIRERKRKYSLELKIQSSKELNSLMFYIFTDCMTDKKNTVFGCSQVEVYWRFEGRYCLHLQGRRVSLIDVCVTYRMY